MLKEIIKVANKLDSLGLTKEADILDNYISKIILDKENVRNASLFKDMFDTAKGMLGFNDPYDHFTTKHEKWQIMKNKMDKGISPLKFISDLEKGIHDEKYIPSEWNKNPSDRKAYRDAMKRAILEYNVSHRENIRHKEKKELDLQDLTRKERDNYRYNRLQSDLEKQEPMYDPKLWEHKFTEEYVPEDPYKFRGVDRIGQPSNPEIDYFNTKDKENIDFDALSKNPL